MEFRFKISKLANLFFFIDNFSEWNIYCRKNYNKEWIKQFGILNSREKLALKNYKLLMQKCEVDGKYKKIRQIFYNEQLKEIDKATSKIKKIISAQDTNCILETFNILQLRFEKMWNKYQPILFYNEKVILKDYKNIKNKLDLIYLKLRNFYGVKFNNQPLYVHLVISPVKQYQGGKVVSKNKISIEVNKLDSENKNQMINYWFLIIHELIHAKFENQKYKNWIKQFAKTQTSHNFRLIKKLGAGHVLREIITSTAVMAACSLLRDNVTDLKKILRTKLRSLNVNDLNILRHWVRYKLEKTVKKYFSSRKRIDINFLKVCWKIIEGYPRDLLQEIKIKNR